MIEFKLNQRDNWFNLNQFFYHTLYIHISLESQSMQYASKWFRVIIVAKVSSIFIAIDTVRFILQTIWYVSIPTNNFLVYHPKNNFLEFYIY